MRTSLRRAIALSGLTAIVVVSGSIAAADGTAVRDITDRALATAPAATELTTEPATDDPQTDRGLDAGTLDRLRAAGDADPVAAPTAPAAPRPRAAPDRGDRTAEPAAASGWTGHASWYGPGFHGNRTASGETYDQHAMTAAHKTLPFGTRLRVTNTANGRSVVVRVNDRGPFVAGRDLDLSRAAAQELGFDGVATVTIERL